MTIFPDESHTKTFPTCRPTLLWLWTMRPYYSTVHNKPPWKYANKKDVVDWLQANECLADISMRKIVLYDFIKN
jgi:hypothetical protein